MRREVDLEIDDALLQPKRLKGFAKAHTHLNLTGTPEEQLFKYQAILLFLSEFPLDEPIYIAGMGEAEDGHNGLYDFQYDERANEFSCQLCDRSNSLTGILLGEEEEATQ